MKTRSKIVLICFLFALAVLGSCIKKEEFDIVPAIKWEGYSVTLDSAGVISGVFLKISYTDGDGNIGYDTANTVPPYKYSFFVKMYKLQNNVLQEIVFPDTTINFNARVPNLTPSGKNKNIQGEIETKINIYYGSIIHPSDTVAFDIYIQDRDLNNSNVIRTPLLPLDQ